MEIIDLLIKEYRNSIKFSPGREPYITLNLYTTSEEKIIEKVKEFLKNCLNKVTTN